MIHAGEWRLHVHMREREECRLHPFYGGDADGGDDAAGCDHPDEYCDFGEEDWYDRCERCDQLVKAIRSVEEGEGCTGEDAAPPLTGLSEAMDYLTDHAAEYAEAAVTMFPGFAASGHLGRFAHAGGPDWEPVDLEPVEVHGGEG